MFKYSKLKQITAEKWLNLFSVTYKNSKNKTVEWFFTSRNKPYIKKNLPDVVVIIPFLEGKMVVIRQLRGPIGEYIIEHPAGLIDDGETVLVAGQRELREETGLIMTTAKVFDTGFLYNSPGTTDESLHYIFSTVEGVPHKGGNKEEEDIEIMTLDRSSAAELIGSRCKMSAKCFLILHAFSLGFNWLEQNR